MRVGINYAWENYAWDFGLPPRKDPDIPWGPRAAFRASIRQELQTLRAMGLFAVRWFLLGDGTTYGVDGARPHPDPRSSLAWRFDDCPQLAPEFLEDFGELLAACAAADMLLLPSLVDFHFCFPGLLIPGSLRHVKCGRSDVLVDPSKREAFLQRVLAPLLEVAAGYRDTVYAFELINEPEWCTREPGSGSDLLDAKKTVPLNDMLEYVRAGAARINRAGFRSTVGFARYQTVEKWRSADLGLSLHQFHYYGDIDVIPPNSFDSRWPLIVGEIATAPHRPWKELGPRQDVLSRLQLLDQKAYPVTFLWSRNRAEESAEEPAVDWSEHTRALVTSFIRGQGGIIQKP
jgi:hypothetical protein